MNRSIRIWGVFGACMALGVAGLLWISGLLLGLERREAQARRQADVEERVRLALWRMDSALAPMVARENARPYFHYRARYPANAAYARMYDRPTAGAALSPSPLLGAETPQVRLHFQIDPAGRFTSPELPESGTTAGLDPVRLAGARARLQELTLALPRDLVAGALQDLGRPSPAEMKARDRERDPALRRAERRDGALGTRGPTEPVADSVLPPAPAAPAAGLAESKAKELDSVGKLELAKNVAEFAARTRQQAASNEAAQQRSAPPVPAVAAAGARTRADGEDALSARPAATAAPQVPAPASPAPASPDPSIAAAPEKKAAQADAGPTAKDRPVSLGSREARALPGNLPEESPFRPCWIGDLLLLVRKVRTAEGEYLQGAWLDWPAIRADLRGRVADLLPEADLAAAGPGIEPGRMLAALPLVLVPGWPPLEARTGPSPAFLALGLGWACALVFGAAAAMLLQQAIALGDRRGAFVSAVTHELRTPLTTFRMYAELLHLGMVEDEQERKSLLQTLVAESDRLDHLVKNVLSYARLESGRGAASLTAMPVAALVERACERVSQRAAQAGMRVEIRVPEELAEASVRTDPSVVEQILFNLVDNACKYAATAREQPILVEAEGAKDRLLLRVRDHGPGIVAADRRKLFRPFHKSAREAARSAPGVGLGLALSRRLAQGLGGDLRLETGGTGASFVLELPWKAQV